MTKHIRTAVAACAAVGVIAAAGVVGVGSAAAADTVQPRSVEVQDPRLPVAESPTIAGVKVTGTRGGAGGFITTFTTCEQTWAKNANAAIEAGLEELYGGNMAAAAEKFGEAVRIINEGEEAGCIFA